MIIKEFASLITASREGSDMISLPKADIYVQYVRGKDVAEIRSVLDKSLRLSLSIAILVSITDKNDQVLSPATTEELAEILNQMIQPAVQYSNDNVGGSLGTVSEFESLVVDAKIGNDATAQPFNPERPYATIRAAANAAYAIWLADSAQRPLVYPPVVYVRRGVYNQHEVNANRSIIFIERGTVIYATQNERSIFSDRGTGANTWLRVFGGPFTAAHLTFSSGNDQETVNFRNTGADVYVENAFMDRAQMWQSVPQRLHLKNCVYHEVQIPGGWFYKTIVMDNCYFPNSAALPAFQPASSVFVLKDCTFDVPNFRRPLRFIDPDTGEVLFTQRTVEANMWQSSSYSNPEGFYLYTPNTDAGAGNIVIEGVSYPIEFDTDAKTTVNSFVQNNFTALTERLGTTLSNSGWKLPFFTKKLTFTGDGQIQLAFGSHTYTLTRDSGDVRGSIKNFITANAYTIGTRGFGIWARNDGSEIYIWRGPGQTGYPAATFSITAPVDFTVTTTPLTGDANAVVSDILGIADENSAHLSTSFASTSGTFSVAVAKMLSDVETQNLIGNSVNGWNRSFALNCSNYVQANKIGATLRATGAQVNLFRPGSGAISFGWRNNEEVAHRGSIEINGMFVTDRTGSATTILGVAFGTNSGLKPIVKLSGIACRTLDTKTLRILTALDTMQWADLYRIPVVDDTNENTTVDNYTATVDPVVTDDLSKGFERKSKFYNNTAGTLWECINPAIGAAVWKQIG
jgi:hypothetical protein